jgi:hypothetical protein
MTTGAFFWRSHIDRVLDNYRRREYCVGTERELEQRLGRLRSRRDTLTSEYAAEIEQQQAKTAETQSQLKDTLRLQKELSDKVDWLVRIRYSFWFKMALSIASLVWKNAIGGREVKRQLPEFAQKLKDTEDKVDYLKRLHFKQAWALQRLAGPIDELNQLVASLERQLDDVGRETADCDKVILDAVQNAVRSASAETIKTRLAGLTTRPDARALTTKVFRLRAVLIELDAIDRGAESELTQTDVRTASDRLRAAIDSSFHSQSRPGNGRIHVTGSGTTHVRKTRRRMVTDRDAHGRTRTTHKTESYWDKINVSFEDTLSIPFDITYRRWNAEPTAAALRDEATTAFALAVQRFRKTSLQKREDALIRQAGTATREVRDILVQALAADTSAPT